MVALIFAEIVSSSLRDRVPLSPTHSNQGAFRGRPGRRWEKKENSTNKKVGAILIPEQRKAVEISYNGNSPDLTFSTRG
jgi:hypothetical protein